MEDFKGLTNKQIQRGLMRFNGLKKFRRDEDVFYSSNGKFIVLGPTAITITRNLRTGKKPYVDINWKVFFSSNFKNGIFLRKKVFIMVVHQVKLADESEDEHLAVIFLDPQEKVARYIDSWIPAFDKINLDAMQKHIPWEVIYGDQNIIPYVYKYENGIPNCCTLDCLFTIDRIMNLNSFSKAATEALFLRRVRRLENQNINIKFPYKRIDYIWYYNGLRYCYDALLNEKVFTRK